MNIPNQPNIIMFNLSRDIGGIINDYLTETTPNYEKLWLEILLTLNNPHYRQHLLFTDYYHQNSQYEFSYQGKKIHTEANFYLTDVLGRTLTLANGIKQTPTNMHALLTAYCAFTQEQRWHDSTIARDAHTTENIGDFFSALAKKLSRQCQKLGDNYSKIAKSRRLEFGPYWFKVENYAAQVAEELNLFQVVETIPTPLNTSLEIPLLLLKVLENLNEKYALLRSCGLPPQQWLCNAKPSIADLEELKQLHKAANRLLKQGEIKTSAYQAAFETLKGERKEFIGFSDFGEFFNSPLSERIFPKLHLVTSDSEFDEPEAIMEIAAPEQVFDENVFLEIVQNYPDDFDDITSQAFYRLIVEEIGLFGKQGLLKDADFLAKVNQHPDYKNLSSERLAKKLQQKLAVILHKHLGNE